jgi:hypothetical protein
MPLSTEPARRFADYVEHADMADADFGHDESLLAFAAWALVHEPSALHEAFALDGVMSERGVNVNKMRYVHAVLGAAHPLIKAYEREQRAQQER